MANAIVLLTVILPTVACFPLVWLLQHLPLGFASLDGSLRVVILTVLALTELRVTCLGAPEADTIHLLALTLGAGTLLLRFIFNLWLNNFGWRLD